MKKPSAVLFACALGALFTAGCMNRHPHTYVQRPAPGLSPIALGPDEGNKVEVAGMSADVDRWARSRTSGRRGASAGQEIGVVLFVRNVEARTQRGVPWRISEGGKVLGSGIIESLAPYEEVGVTAPCKIPSGLEGDLHFLCEVNRDNKLKEDADGLGDNRIAVRVPVVSETR